MMTRSCRAVLWLLVFPFLFLGAAASFAVEPDEMLADPALEARARALSAELRCVVCQNQSIDDSNAPLARDLRILLRERLAAGDSDEQVKQFLVDRYGAFVLLRPPFNAHTLLLWLAPPIILVGAGVLLFRYMSGRGRTAPAEVSQSLTAEEEEKLRSLLAAESRDAGSAGRENR